ncbi:MAG TPA: hypothetical protein VF950_00915 [Planctomycetota bacterium]
MVVRKCRQCDAVWRSDLSQCAFCGQEGESQDVAATALAVLDRPSNGTPKKDPEPAATKPPGSFVAPPPAPRLPSANVPPLFGLLGLAAAALLPAAFLTAADRVAAILLFLGVALFAPFGPLAWWAGWRYQVRCAELGFQPSAAARAGGLLGVAVTLLLSVEGSALAFLRALRHLQE